MAKKNLAEAETNTSEPEGSVNSDYYLSFIPKKKEPFKFKEITPEQIIKCVFKMKNSKPGKIPTIFGTDTIEVTAPVSLMFNKSTRKSVFPENLKIGKYVQYIRKRAPNLILTIIDLYQYSQ